MTETATRTSDGTSAAGGDAITTAMAPMIRQVVQELLTEAGRRLLDAAVDRAVSTVEGVTGRLEDVAENGGAGLSSALTGRSPEATAGPSSDQQPDGQGMASGLRARVGAAFGLLLRKAQQLLQFLAQQALRGLQALKQLTGRGEESGAEQELDQEQGDEFGQASTSRDTGDGPHDVTAEDDVDQADDELDDDQDEEQDADDPRRSHREVAAR